MPKSIAILILYRATVFRFDIAFDDAHRLAKEFTAFINGKFPSFEAARLSAWHGLSAAIDDGLIDKFGSRRLGADGPFTDMATLVSWLILSSEAFEENDNWGGYVLQIGEDPTAEFFVPEMEMEIDEDSPYSEGSKETRLFSVTPLATVAEVNEAAGEQEQEVERLKYLLENDAIVERYRQPTIPVDTSKEPAGPKYFSFLVTYFSAELRFNIEQTYALRSYETMHQRLSTIGRNKPEDRNRIWEDLIGIISRNEHLQQDKQVLMVHTLIYLALGAPGRKDHPEHTGFHLRIGIPPMGRPGVEVIRIQPVGRYPEILRNTQMCEVDILPDWGAVDAAQAKAKEEWQALAGQINR